LVVVTAAVADALEAVLVLVAPIAPEPLVPVVSVPLYAETTAAALELPAVQLKVTAALNTAVANARHISIRQVVLTLSARTNSHVNPPPVTEVTGVVVFGIAMWAIKSSLAPEVVRVPVTRVVFDDEPLVATIATSKATGIMSPLWLL
jgi:hypothetical protein